MVADFKASKALNPPKDAQDFRVPKDKTQELLLWSQLIDELRKHFEGAVFGKQETP